MKIRRKPLTLTAWHNSKGPTPGGKPAEPLPLWLKKVAEKDAAPDTTFTFDQGDRGGRRLCFAGDIVYQAVDGSIHSISPTRFKQEYEIADIQAKIAQPEPPPEAA